MIMATILKALSAVFIAETRGKGRNRDEYRLFFSFDMKYLLSPNPTVVLEIISQSG